MARQEYVLCQLCGVELDTRTIQKHYVIPKELMEQARMRRARIVRICPECSKEIQAWNNAKIDKNVFDTQIKKFRNRLPAEMVKEYEGAFNRFARYKKNQAQIV